MEEKSNAAYLPAADSLPLLCIAFLAPGYIRRTCHGTLVLRLNQTAFCTRNRPCNPFPEATLDLIFLPGFTWLGKPIRGEKRRKRKNKRELCILRHASAVIPLI